MPISLLLMGVMLVIILVGFLVVKHLKSLQEHNKNIAKEMGFDYFQKPDVNLTNMLLKVNILKAGRKPFISSLLCREDEECHSYFFDFSRSLGQGGQTGAPLRPVALFKMKKSTFPSEFNLKREGLKKFQDLKIHPVLSQPRILIVVDKEWIMCEQRKNLNIPKRDWIEKTTELVTKLCEINRQSGTDHG